MNAGGIDDWRHYISAGGQAVAIVSRKAGVTTTRYLLNDHLGSIAAIVDGSGAPILTESFDAFGARRDGEDWDSDCNCSKLAQIASITRHGFTGHEMIGGHSMGLIHMNGRVMDSVTGRFLSPDPFVQFPFDSQSFNRYSYVRNNPLSSTDPSGFQEYDGDVIERPEWEPPICWTMGICGGGLNLFPRNYVIVRPPEPKIPPSRAIPQAVPGPPVPANTTLKDVAVGGADLVTDFVPGVSTVKGIYQAIDVITDPNSTKLEVGIALVGIVPGGKVLKYGGKLVKAVDAAGDAGTVAAKRVEVSASKYPEGAAHVRDAQVAGQPKVLTVDRPGTDANRAAAQAGHPRTPGKDLDEYPPAMFREGGSGASVRPMTPAQNRGMGSCIGNQCRGVPDGSQVEIVVVD